jgi:hypothetical protein
MIRDFVLHAINIYYELKIIKLLNTKRMSHLKIRVFRMAFRTKLCFFFLILADWF